MVDLVAYTDGACSGNPGPGGWGVLMLAREDGVIIKEKTLQGGEADTTNNRMELMAAISALEALTKDSVITVVTDSAYVKNGITDWMAGWKRKGWRTAGGPPVKNVDLWQRLDAAQARHQVVWKWIKGHAGHAENERADELARAGMAPFEAGKGRVMTLIQGLDYASVAVFALTGALVASRSQLDIVGFIFVACLTAVGGGTVRDMILNRDMVFWVADPLFLLVAVIAAVVVFFTAHLLESRYRAILWLDAFALAAAVPAGVGVALDHGAVWPIVVVMGMITGCLGGLMRDVVCNEVPLVLRQGELYVTAAFAGAVAAVGLLWAGAETREALVGCAALVLILRMGSLGLGWRLPVYKPRPPRADAPKR